MKLENSFDQFFGNIALGDVPEGRILSAWRRLHGHLVEKAGVPAELVFLQGSYANDTAIQPVDPAGGYDLDVCAVIADASMAPLAAFEFLESILSLDEDYAKRLDRSSNRCVRLRYADDETGKFHVDVVAARPHPDGHLEIPLRDGAWKPTAPREYTDWCRGRGEQFGRTVRMLKRWRDVNQDERRGVKSIVLQVLVAQHLAGSDDATALHSALHGIKQFLVPYAESPPPVPNPVLPAENLAATWPATHYRSFRRHVEEAAEAAETALWSGDIEESHVLWRDLLGEDFPPAPTDPAGRERRPPATPAPGFEKLPQRAPRRERYGREL